MRRPARLLHLAAAILAVGLAAASQGTPSPWLVNETASVPRGLYRRVAGEPRVGALVALTPPAAAQAYLQALGAPAGALLLKRVAAGPGETVCGRARRLTWPRGGAVRMPSDRQGRALPAWTGCRRLTAGELLVVGDSPASFDSRYFGPVRSMQVAGIYREVFRW